MDFSARFHAFFASRRGIAVAVLVLIVLMVVSANIVAARFLTSRLDLTAEHLYTLSPGTRNTLAKIDEPITLRFYYSTRLGDAVPVLRRLRPAGTRVARPICRSGARQDSARSLQPAGFFGCRGPRRCFRAQGCAARCARRAGLFRSCGHQLDRRSAGHRLFRAGA